MTLNNTVNLIDQLLDVIMKGMTSIRLGAGIPG